MANSIEFPSPHPGIINFFSALGYCLRSSSSFRPLIRGLSISSFLLPFVKLPFTGFPSPHPGIINFFYEGSV